MRSPPTSPAIDARSSVVEITLSLACACARIGASSTTKAMKPNMNLRMMIPLERVRAVRADGKLELEQQLVGDRPFRVVRAAVLSADLAEFAGPVRQDSRPAPVEGRGRVSPIRPIVTAADEPAPRKLIVARRV